MSTKKEDGVDVKIVSLDSVIPFNSGVDCVFYANMLLAAAKHWKAQNKPINVPNSEAIRRAIALIEAIFTDQVIVEESR